MRLRTALLIGLLAASGFPGGPAFSAPPPAAPGVQGGAADASAGDVWTVAPDYEAAVRDAGQPLPASVFTSVDFRRLLVVPVSGPSAYVFSLLPKTVATLPLKAIQDEGHRAIVPRAPEPAPFGSFTEQGAVISFQSGPLTIRITPEPALSGDVSLQAILNRKPEYAAAAKLYQPDRAAIETLKKWSQPVDIVVFFGTWCPICRQRLPMLLKVIDEANNPNLRVRFIAVDPDWKAPRQEIEQFRVHLTPTFIVMSGSRELGRIDRKPPQSLEASLLQILTNG